MAFVQLSLAPSFYPFLSDYLLRYIFEHCLKFTISAKQFLMIEMKSLVFLLKLVIMVVEMVRIERLR